MYKGKAIYNPSGKAGEYSYWACNFYVGCSNGCHYCYLKKGRGKLILGGDKPMLKKCFKNETNALDIFKKELRLNLDELRKHGLFFSFTTDPLIEETWYLTALAVNICIEQGVPVKILTKSIEFIDSFHSETDGCGFNVAIGFTLTMADELEPNASNNWDRMEHMELLSDAGYKTFASIEPIISFDKAKQIIAGIEPYCNLIKIGLEAGKKYDQQEARDFIDWLTTLDTPVYLKESLCKTAKYWPQYVKPFVPRDYNIFI